MSCAGMGHARDVEEARDAAVSYADTVTQMAEGVLLLKRGCQSRHVLPRRRNVALCSCRKHISLAGQMLNSYIPLTPTLEVTCVLSLRSYILDH